MTDAPERIWVDALRGNSGGEWREVWPSSDSIAHDEVAYLRADLAAARIAALVADLARARERVEALERERDAAWEAGRDAAAAVLQDDIDNAHSWANAEPAGSDDRKGLLADAKDKSRLQAAIRALKPAP
jgi:hypothetical protein